MSGNREIVKFLPSYYNSETDNICPPPPNQLVAITAMENSSGKEREWGADFVRVSKDVLSGPVTQRQCRE